MKYLKHFLIAVCMCLMLAGTSWATSVINIDDYTDVAETILYDAWYSNSGEFMFATLGNNDGNQATLDAVEVNVNNWLIANSYSAVTLLETTATIDVNGADPDTGAIITDPTTETSGLWNVTDPSDGTINFYAIKASRGYAMFLLDPAAGDGSWSTYELFMYLSTLSENPFSGESLQFSHFTGYNPGDPGDAVPEPATIFLFGAGLLGLAAVQRKRLNKKNNK